MKQFLFIILTLFSLSAIGQVRNPIPLKDTITNERDTIVKFIISDEYNGHIYFVVDSLTGTFDGLAELVVADDVDSNYPSSTFPHDSLFLRYTHTMSETIDANGAYSFMWDQPLGYDYVGLKLTLNSITKWHINYKTRLFRIQ